jgi:hypothetical protein
MLDTGENTMTSFKTAVRVLLSAISATPVFARLSRQQGGLDQGNGVIRSNRTPIAKKLIPLAASLAVVAGSPQFGAGRHYARPYELTVPTFAHRQGPASHRAGADPYFGLWVQGYPQSS